MSNESLFPDESNPVHLVPLDCGVHHGLPRADGSTDCRKCEDYYRTMNKPLFRAGLQASGTPWVAIFHPPTGHPEE